MASRSGCCGAYNNLSSRSFVPCAGEVFFEIAVIVIAINKNFVSKGLEQGGVFAFPMTFISSIMLKLMDLYFFVKTLHILSAAVLFGTGLGTAFFMFMSRYTPDMHEKFYAARMTVLADYLFTAPAVILQPLTGIWLIWKGGYDPMSPWLVWTYGIYTLAGLCWLPVVWIQIRLKRMLKTSLDAGTPLPGEYHRLFRIWFILGWPAFLGLVAVFFLMVMKPA